MKTITCAQMGGPATCTTALTGSTMDEMMQNAWKHLEQAHPDLAEGIKNNPPEVNQKWQAEFAEKFKTLPEA